MLRCAVTVCLWEYGRICMHNLGSFSNNIIFLVLIVTETYGLKIQTSHNATYTHMYILYSSIERAGNKRQVGLGSRGK